MGKIVDSYKRLPEHTMVPDDAWEIDNLIDEIGDLSKQLERKQAELIDKLSLYHSYLLRHWTQQEIEESQKE